MLHRMMFCPCQETSYGTNPSQKDLNVVLVFLKLVIRYPGSGSDISNYIHTLNLALDHVNTRKNINTLHPDHDSWS